MRKLFLTLGYSGLSPKAPGTAGSVVSLILALIILNYLPVSTILYATILITIIAVKEIDKYEKDVGEHDGKEIVIDELAGMWLALGLSIIFTEIDISNTNHLLIISFLSFILFRFFDIAKPSIIGKIDKNMAGGWGVMLDDILAGLFAGILTALVWKIIIIF